MGTGMVNEPKDRSAINTDTNTVKDDSEKNKSVASEQPILARAKDGQSSSLKQEAMEHDVDEPTDAGNKDAQGDDGMKHTMESTDVAS